MRGRSAFAIPVLGLVLALAGAAGATEIGLSTTGGATLGGLTFRNGDIAKYDDVGGTAVLYFDENLFGAFEDIDAFELLPNGHMLISTTSTATLGGLTFANGSLAAYDPIANVATLYFDEALFGDPGGTADIDGVALLPNGNLLLSTTSTQTLGGLTFRDGDIIEYDPILGTATLFFNEDLFGADHNIDAIEVLADGRTLILSTFADAILGGLAFLNGDLVLYNLDTGVATLFFSEALFSGPENIDAVAIVPEPGAAALVAMGLLALAAGRRSRR